MTISNPRDLVVQELGELLYVERRLADDVIGTLIEAVHDEGLRAVLEQHRTETRGHVERLESAFRALEVSATSNRSASFEGAVAQHEELAGSIVDPRLADLFHAHAALQVEHWEMAAYRSVLPLAPRDAADVLKPTLDEEGRAAKALVAAVDRLAAAG